MNLVHAPLGTEVTVPTARDLEALTPADRWAMEEHLDEAQGILREFNDKELQRWVEVEGKTQREIAAMVGRSKRAIARRCERLGLHSGDPRGGSRLGTGTQSDRGTPEPTKPAPKRTQPDGPDHHLPDVVAPDAEDNLRTQALHWFEQGLVVRGLLDKRRPLEPRSDEDRQAIKREAALMERVARRIKERCE